MLHEELRKVSPPLSKFLSKVSPELKGEEVDQDDSSVSVIFLVTGTPLEREPKNYHTTTCSQWFST